MCILTGRAAGFHLGGSPPAPPRSQAQVAMPHQLACIARAPSQEAAGHRPGDGVAEANCSPILSGDTSPFQIVLNNL